MEPIHKQKPVVLLSNHFQVDVKQLFEKRGFHVLLADQSSVENDTIEVIVKESLFEPAEYRWLVGKYIGLPNE